MRRLFWLSLGATIGVLAVRKVTRAAQAYTPAGLSSGLSNLGEGLKDLAAAVREGMSEREQDLRQALGIDTDTMPGDESPMSDEDTQMLLDDPTGRRGRPAHQGR